METALYIFLGGAVIALAGWFFIPRINRDIAAKSAAQSRIRGFFDFVAEFNAEVVAPRRPDIWVPYFIQNAPELKARFDQIDRDLSAADRAGLNEGVDAVLAFSRLLPAEIYEQEDKLKEAIKKIARFYDA